ncbi:MAG: fumarylacetoacetate hydrolase family protein [Candidatus Omnitrophota bacterium]
MRRLLSISLIILCFAAFRAASEEIFCRYQLKDKVFYGQVDGNTIHQLSRAPWDGGKATGKTDALDKVRLLHPSEPKKIIGMSGTYKEAWEGGKTPFKTVRWFMKPSTTAASPGEDVVLPASLDELQVETELAIVIGKRVKNASLEEAKAAIFGYAAANDIVGDPTSYHRIQGEPLDQPETLLPASLKHGDQFSPYGPFIHRGVDWNNRKRTLIVTHADTGEKEIYEHNTSSMIYTPEKIVSDLSRVFSLDPGDVILSGTTKALPARAGDVMEVEVEGIGKLVNRVAPGK